MTTANSEQTQILREILKWIKFAGIKEVKAILADNLDADSMLASKANKSFS